MRNKQQRGAMLIEALVGFLVFSVGVLALVGLQASMVRAQTSAKFRADATNLANEVIGIMWGDAVGNMSKYTTANCESYARCKEWKEKLAVQLPDGTVAITHEAARGLTTVTITWTQPDEGSHKVEIDAVAPVI